MSHDKIKAAARRRMAATGEPYIAARRRVISGHDAARGTSAVSADDVRAAAEVQRELGPEYSDAVVASFIDKVDKAVAARVEARLAEQARSGPAKQALSRRQLLLRRVARDTLVASAGALVAVGAVGLHEITSPQHPAAPVSRGANVVCTSTVARGSWCVVLRPPATVRLSRLKSGGQLKAEIAELRLQQQDHR
jgi:hypothetical protein